MTFAEQLAAEFAGAAHCGHVCSWDATMVCARTSGHEGAHAAEVAGSPVQWVEV